MLQREIDAFLLLCFVTAECVQHQKTIKGCISGDVNMEFKPDILKCLEVKSYEWCLPRAHEAPQLWAKFEPNKSTDITRYFLKLDGRLFHNPIEPTNLYFRNLTDFDENEYTLFISYINYIGPPTEYILYLDVEDVCFGKPNEVDNCAVTTCYTGDNGVLKMPGNQTEVVNGSKLVRVCNDSASGNYSCCNAAGTCLEQLLKIGEDTMPLDDEPSSTVIITTLVIVLVIAVAVGVTTGVLLFLKNRRGASEIKQ